MNDAALLELWESALPLGAAARERLLGQAAGADGSASLGERQAALLRLREQLFGRAMALRANCPQCEAALDFEIDCARLHALAPQAGDAAAAAGVVHELQIGALQLRFRAALADDVEAARRDAGDDVGAFARCLFERCIVEAVDGGRAIETHTLSADVRQAVAQRLDAIEPTAHLEFALECVDCGLAFGAPLDTAGVLWSEVRHRAEQVLADVAALASRYGWRESDVLALGPARRDAYLQLSGATG